MKPLSDPALERYAKLLVVNCVRNTFLEDIHSGAAQLGDEEMKKLMKEITNRVYTFLKFIEDQNFMTMMSHAYPDKWDKAELDPDFMGIIKSLTPPKRT